VSSTAKPTLDRRRLLDDIYRRAEIAGYDRVRLDGLLDVAEAGGIANVMNREAREVTHRRSRLRALNREEIAKHCELHGLVDKPAHCDGDDCKSKRPLLKTHAAFLQKLHMALFDAEARAWMLPHKSYGHTDGADTLGGVLAMLRDKLGLTPTELGFLRTVHRKRRQVGREDLPDELFPSVGDEIVKAAAHAASDALYVHDSPDGVSKRGRVSKRRQARVRSDRPSRKE
jgi:hypothetical protein